MSSFSSTALLLINSAVCAAELYCSANFFVLFLLCDKTFKNHPKMSHNIFSSLWSNFVLFFLLKLSVFPFPINFCWVNKTCIWSVPTALYYCNSKKIQFSFQLAQISTEAVSQPTMQPGSKAGQSQGSWFCLIVDLYLKWSLVVSDPILKNENVA